MSGTDVLPILTAEDLLRRGDLPRCELIDGRVVEMSPSGFDHGRVVSRVNKLLTIHIDEHGLGIGVGAETGFVLQRDPDRVRAPDFAFIRHERMPSGAVPGFFEGAPDLAVEVNSPFDRASEVLAKVDDWLRCGAASCWVVDPPTKSITVHRAAGVRRFRSGDVIDDEATLPGLVLRIDEVFAR